MVDRDAESVLKLATKHLRTRNFGEFIRDVGLGTLFMAVILNVTDIISAGAMLIINPLVGTAESVEAVIRAVIGGQADVVAASIQAAITSYQEGSAAVLGPFAPILSAVVVAIILWIVLEALDRIEFSPLAVWRGWRGD